MLPQSIQLIVVTPERQLLNVAVVEVTVPGLDGELGVLPGHAPLITELGIGELKYRAADASQSEPLRFWVASRKFSGIASRCWRKPRSVRKKLISHARKRH